MCRKNVCWMLLFIGTDNSSSQARDHHGCSSDPSREPRLREGVDSCAVLPILAKVRGAYRFRQKVAGYRALYDNHLNCWRTVGELTRTVT